MASFVRRDLRNTFPLDQKKLTFMIVTMIIIMILMPLMGTKLKRTKTRRMVKSHDVCSESAKARVLPGFELFR